MDITCKIIPSNHYYYIVASLYIRIDITCKITASNHYEYRVASLYIRIDITCKITPSNHCKVKFKRKHVPTIEHKKMKIKKKNF